jgi:hypothetical protein
MRRSDYDVGVLFGDVTGDESQNRFANDSFHRAIQI